MGKNSHGLFINLAFLSVLCPSAAFADAPNLLTYQGRLKESGQPAGGTRTVQFRLCADPDGASCFNTSPVSQSVTVSNGLFKSTFAVPSSINMASGVWYLELTVNGNTYLPREQFTSVPYAVYAASATSLTAPPGSAGVFIATNVFVTAGGKYYGDGTSLTGASRDDVQDKGADPGTVTLSASDFGKTFISTGSADTTNYLLPAVTAADIGARLKFVKLGAGRVTITAAAGTYISDSGPGGTIYNSDPTDTDATITLTRVQDVQWAISGGYGAWVTTN